ncbi:MAG: lytic transglycosylase domain-containing protein, partial [Alphaproteobacteria bacterium]|nr:lytic transglycosylase domain-containing protein [Alphaproteobacteria bacterium]
TPGAAAARLFPEAARANKAIFYHDGQPRSVAQVYASLTSQGGGDALGVDPRSIPSAADEGWVEYASARREDRLAAQDEVVAMILRGSQPADQMGVGTRLTGSMFTSEMLKLLSDSRDQS